MTSKIEDRVTSIIEDEVKRSIYEAPRIHDYGFDLGTVARSIALRSAAKILAALGLVERTIDRDRIKQGDAMELAVVDHGIDEIEGEALELVPIDREKIKRWVILHRPIFEWSALSASTLSSVIDFAIDKIEEGPVEVTEISKRNGHELRVIPTGEVGSHSGCRLHRVECVTCKVIVHEATSGPSQMIEDHLREARTGMQSPLVAAPADPLQVGYLSSVGDRVMLDRIYDSAPPNHVGDLTKRLVRRILFASCSANSGECAIRQECVNKCGGTQR